MGQVRSKKEPSQARESNPELHTPEGHRFPCVSIAMFAVTPAWGLLIYPAKMISIFRASSIFKMDDKEMGMQPSKTAGHIISIRLIVLFHNQMPG